MSLKGTPSLIEFRDSRARIAVKKQLLFLLHRMVQLIEISIKWIQALMFLIDRLLWNTPALIEMLSIFSKGFRDAGTIWSIKIQSCYQASQWNIEHYVLAAILPYYNQQFIVPYHVYYLFCGPSHSKHSWLYAKWLAFEMVRWWAFRNVVHNTYRYEYIYTMWLKPPFWFHLYFFNEIPPEYQYGKPLVT